MDTTLVINQIRPILKESTEMEADLVNIKNKKTFSRFIKNLGKNR